MPVTILEGSTFCLSDEVGDLDGQGCGFFAEDTRFLSALRLTINGERPLLLSSGKVEYFSAAFFLRNPAAGGLDPDTLSITRWRFVGEAMQDQLIVTNQAAKPVSFELRLELGSDFADIFAVKSRDFALGDPAHALPLPPPAVVRYDPEECQFVLEDRESQLRSHVILSEPGEPDEGGVRYRLELQPRERWQLIVGVRSEERSCRERV